MKHRLLLLALAGAGACAPARFVKPLEKGQHAVSASLGGPLITYGKLAIPLPFLTASYGYGLSPTLTGFGAVNVTSGLYGNAQLELGVTKQLLAPATSSKWVPGLSVTPAATIIYRNRDARKFYPTLDAAAFWNYGSRQSYWYLGVSNWLELSRRRVFDQPQQERLLFAPLVGTVVGGEQWSFTAEAKVIAPNLANNFNTAEYKSPLGTHGAFGIYLGCTRKF